MEDLVEEPVETVAPVGCPACVCGTVRPTGKPGRTRRMRDGGRMVIPEDLLIPTCDACGAEWLDHETAKSLAALDRV
jgi:hypothetical protein